MIEVCPVLYLKPRLLVWLLIVMTVGCSKPAPKGPSKAELIQQGDAFMASRDYGKAADAYAGAAKGKADGALLMKLAKADVAAGRTQEGYKSAARAADARPDDLEAQLYAATLQVGLKQYEEATSRLAKIAEAHGDNVEVLILQANVAARLPYATAALIRRGGSRLKPGDSGWVNVRMGASADGDAKAEKLLRRAVALETDPKAVAAKEALINFLWAVGRADEAEPMLKQLADGHPEDWVANVAQSDYLMMRDKTAEGEQYLKRAAAVPDGLNARRKLVNFYLGTKRNKDAADALTSMLATDDADGSISVRLARIELQMGESDKALQRVEPLLARKPPVDGAAVVKAQVLIGRGDTAQALALAHAAADGDPGSSLARFTLGQILAAAGNLEDAYTAQKEAVSLQTGRIDATQELARLAIALELPQALGHARDAVRLQPGDRDAALNLVRALILVKNYNDADEALKPLLKSEPAAADVLVQSGTLLAVRGSDDAARSAFTRALQADPDSFDAVSGLVSLDLKQKKMSAARQRVEEQVAKHPRAADYLELAARVYTADHDDARAESTLRQAVQFDPANLGATLALVELLGPRKPDEARQVLEKLLERRPHAAKAKEALDALRARTSGR